MSKRKSKTFANLMLMAGIIFLPYVFAWFTLRRERSKTARMLAFGWLGFCVLAVLIAPNDQHQQTSTTQAESSTASRYQSPTELSSAGPASTLIPKDETHSHKSVTTSHKMVALFATGLLLIIAIGVLTKIPGVSDWLERQREEQERRHRELQPAKNEQARQRAADKAARSAARAKRRQQHADDKAEKNRRREKRRAEVARQRAEHEAEITRSRAVEEKRIRALHAAGARNRSGVRLLKLLAYSDDKLSRIEANIIESYAQSGPNAVPVDFQESLKSGIPSMNERRSILMQITSTFTTSEIEVLARHVGLMMGAKTRHAPTIQHWFDDTLSTLGVPSAEPSRRPMSADGGKPAHDPYDISPL